MKHVSRLAVVVAAALFALGLGAHSASAASSGEISESAVTDVLWP